MTNFTHFLLWKLGLVKPWTWYTEEECQILEKYASDKKRILEIGCWQGVNTAKLCKVMNSQGILFAVDPYPAGRLGFSAADKIAHEEVAKIKKGSVRWLKMTDVEAAKVFVQEKQPLLDFIFSDSLNDYEGFQNTWEAWKNLLAPNGIYILANSRATTSKPIQNAGSVRFTQEVILKDPNFEFVENVGCFTILKKRHAH